MCSLCFAELTLSASALTLSENETVTLTLSLSAPYRDPSLFRNISVHAVTATTAISSNDAALALVNYSVTPLVFTDWSHTLKVSVTAAEDDVFRERHIPLW